MYTISGRRVGDEFVAALVDENTSPSIAKALMSKYVLVELVTRNIDKIEFFKLRIDGDVEYMDKNGDEKCANLEVTD